MGHDPILVGWREWVALPDLGIARIKVKVDTGARTSALHAFELESYETSVGTRVRFSVHVHQKDLSRVVHCDEPVIDRRWVTDSGGHREQRYVIQTRFQLAPGLHWPIELTLTNRDTMRFRMLLGRTAMAQRLVIDPSASFLLRARQRLPRSESSMI